MPRGKTAKDGDETTNALGYRQRRVDGVWRPVHHLIAEEKLGRPIDATEMVKFADGDRSNLNPDNIVVQPRPSRKSKEVRIAKIQSQIADLQAELELLLKE